jgi:acyl carrier protein
MDTAHSHDTKARLRSFIGTFVRKKDFSNADNIFASGFVNSMFVMQLILFVEKEFHLTVENEDLDLNNFSSIDVLDDFIARKRKSSRAQAD